MKLRTIISAIVLIILSGFTGLKAQNIDHARMNRDINIMENILGEMFKTSWASGKSTLTYSGSLSFSQQHIKGTYLQGYGVIFTVLGGPPVVGLINDGKGNTPAYQFQYANNGSKKITKEAIIQRIQDLLQDYGPTLGQLSNDDRITVIYKNDPSKRLGVITVFSSDTANNSKKGDAVYTLTVTTKKSDLQALQRGSISKNQFDDRLAVSTIEKDGDNHHDVKIMANILKAAFKNTGKKEFKISGSVNHLYLDKLGALFYIDATYGSSFYNLNVAIHTLKNEIPKIVHTDSNVVTITTPSTVNGQDKNALEINEAKAYHKFLTTLKETIVDYGSTLRSVQSDEQIYVSVMFSGSAEKVPERVDFQIKKSVLNQLDKGSISRQQAIDRIKVREYRD